MGLQAVAAGRHDAAVEVAGQVGGVELRSGTGRQGFAVAPANRADRRVAAVRVIFAIALVGAWEFSARTLVDPMWIGQPSAIAARLWSLVASGDLWWHAFPTIGQAAAGLALSILVGVPVGALLASHRFVQRVLEPYLLGLYSIPRIALAPLFILWFGIGPASKIVMAFSLVVFVVILNTYEGLRSVDRDLIDMLRAMRAPRTYIWRVVLLPGILPWVLASVRVGVGLALIGSVVGELLGSNRGLGWYVENAAARIDVIGVFTGLIVLMIVGMGLNEVMRQVERRLLRGRDA